MGREDHEENRRGLPLIARIDLDGSHGTREITVGGRKDSRSIFLQSALPLIFSNLRERGRAPKVAADELMANVEIYNAVPADAKAAYRTAILREYAAYWRGEMR